MSLPNSPNFANDYPQIQGIGVFPTDSEKLLFDRGRAFWESEPTGIWVPKVAETLGQLANGATIIGLSGRYGIGKTMQFMRLLERTIPDIGFGYDAPQNVIEDDQEVPRQLIIDELGTGQNTYGKVDLINGLAERLVDRQAVVISPGATKNSRRDTLESFMEGWQVVKPNSIVYDLGDIDKASILSERAAAVIEASGGDKEAIELFTQFDLLRNTRLFDSIFLHPGNRPRVLPETFGAEDVVELLKDTVIIGSRGQDGLIRADRVLSMLLPPGSSAIRGLGVLKHLLFTSGHFTTEQITSVYDLISEPLPRFSQDDIARIGFDPYQKD